jgi:hypothetical protein
VGLKSNRQIELIARVAVVIVRTRALQADPAFAGITLMVGTVAFAEKTDIRHKKTVTQF